MGKAFDLRLGTASHGLCSKLTESHPRSLRCSGRAISQAAYIGKLSGIHMITSSASPLQFGIYRYVGIGRGGIV